MADFGNFEHDSAEPTDLALRNLIHVTRELQITGPVRTNPGRIVV